jgi:hypothetical protein
VILARGNQLPARVKARSNQNHNASATSGAAATLLPSSFILEVKPIIVLICPSASIMPRFRKSKSSANPPVSTPALPAELVQNLASQRDSRALVASSTAIALSISSAFCDVRDTPSNDTTARGRDTGWQTAYNAAKIAVEITKESSDMFLPLKAVVGAISVLIKNYDVGVSDS